MGVAKQPFQLRIEWSDGGPPVIFDGVEEFVSGFKYLYVRAGSQTLSFHRDRIGSVTRKMTPSSDWTPVNLRHPAK